MRNHQKIVWLLGVSIIAFMLLLLIPVIISAQLQQWILDNGGDQTSIDNIDFNVFTGDFVLEGLSIKQKKREPLQLKQVAVTLNWLDLFHHSITFDNIKISSVEIYVDQSLGKQGHIGGIFYQSFLQDEKKSAPVNKQVDSPWAFQVKRLSLDHIDVFYKGHEINSVVKLTTLSLSNFDSNSKDSSVQIDFSGFIDQAPVRINGTFSQLLMKPSFKGKLSLKHFNVRDYLPFITPKLQHSKLFLTLQGDVDFLMQDNGFSVDHDGGFMLEKASIQNDTLKLTMDKLSWLGSINLTSSGVPSIAMSTDGKLIIDQLWLNDQTVEQVIQSDEFVWQGKMDVDKAKDNDLSLLMNGYIQNDNLKIDNQSQAFLFQNKHLNWQGDINLSASNDDQWKLKGKSKFQNESLSLQSVPKQLQVKVNALAWQGDYLIDSNDLLRSKGEIKLKEVTVETLDANEHLLGFDELMIDGLNVQSFDVISVNQIVSQNLSLGKPRRIEEVDINTPAIIKNETLMVDNVRYVSQESINVDTITFQGLDLNLWKDPKGKWVYESLIEAFDFQFSNKEESFDQNDKKTLPIVIEKLVVLPESQLLFVDQSLPETLVQKVDITSMQLLHLDSHQEAVSSELSLIWKMNDKARLMVNGRLSPFSQPVSFDLKAQIEALSLIPYNSLLKKSMGYRFNSGTLNANGRLQGNDGHLDSEFTMILHQLDLNALSEKELKQIDATLNTGLESGLSLLKDKNNTIELKIPVRGQYDQLKLDPSNIINKALASALGTGAKTYFAAALFPFGTLLVIADAVTDQAMKVRLDPVFFDVGADTFDAKFYDYLDKVAAILDEKPAIFIKLCGVSVTEDRQFFLKKMEAEFVTRQLKNMSKDSDKTVKFVMNEKQLDTQLITLAHRRSKIIETYLMDKQGVDRKRLIDCQARIEIKDKKAKPRADLLL